MRDARNNLIEIFNKINNTFGDAAGIGKVDVAKNVMFLI
jgi:hypothetical protein